MAKAGINKTILASLGGEAHCFMADADVAEAAKQRGVTRALVSMEKAAKLSKPCIFAIGNARCPYIIARGRKGGSSVAAAICNAMLYQIRR